MNTKSLFLYLPLLLALMIGSVGCSKDDDMSSANDDKTPTIYSPTALYAAIRAEGEEVSDVNSSDIVLTLNDIIAVNPMTQEFKIKDEEGDINVKSYPFPTQYYIMFYSEGTFLFEAKLNSIWASFLQRGLSFTYHWTDKTGLSQYYFEIVMLHGQDGTIEGTPSVQQDEGMKRMYEILESAGKNSSNIEYDFQY